jgi:hypothetical protein
MENASVQISFKRIHFSPQLKPHRRDTSERPIANNAGDRGDESARQHRVDVEAIEQLRDQEAAERAGTKARQHREHSTAISATRLTHPV